MRNYLLWLFWLMAILALYAAIQARTPPTSESDACKSYIYWESPLLK